MVDAQTLAPGSLNSNGSSCDGAVGVLEPRGCREVAVAGLGVLVVASAEGRPGVRLQGQTRHGRGGQGEAGLGKGLHTCWATGETFSLVLLASPSKKSGAPF